MKNYMDNFKFKLNLKSLNRFNWSKDQVKGLIYGSILIGGLLLLASHWVSFDHFFYHHAKCYMNQQTQLLDCSLRNKYI